MIHLMWNSPYGSDVKLFQNKKGQKFVGMLDLESFFQKLSAAKKGSKKQASQPEILPEMVV